MKVRLLGIRGVMIGNIVQAAIWALIYLALGAFEDLKRRCIFRA